MLQLNNLLKIRSMQNLMVLVKTWNSDTVFDGFNLLNFPINNDETY